MDKETSLCWVKGGQGEPLQRRLTKTEIAALRSQGYKISDVDAQMAQLKRVSEATGKAREQGKLGRLGHMLPEDDR